MDMERMGCQDALLGLAFIEIQKPSLGELQG